MEMFYEVYVANNSFRGRTLTYSYAGRLKAGQIVSIPLRQDIVLGVIKAPVGKPGIKVKTLRPLDLPVLPKASLKLIEWLPEYYPAHLSSIVKLFMPAALTDKSIKKHSPDKTINYPKFSAPNLTGEQEKAVKSFNWSGTNFLHGETGSGKTRVYQELASKSIDMGKSVIILSPEIGLGYQLFDNFYKLFGNRVLLSHSNLTLAEKRQAWLDALTSKQPLIIIGARSALFTPINNIGLVVVDEAHDSAYKQEQAPYYNSILVAGKLAQINQAPLLLGTATPNVTDYFLAASRGAQPLRLSQLAIAKPSKVDVEIVDLKDKTQFSNSPHISDKMLWNIKQAIGKGEQILLFLNRRGTARVVICRQCGWQALCPKCDTALIYHGDNFKMVCHVCNYRSPVITNCPECGSVDILYKSAGTKAIVEEIKKSFPSARVQRFDADTIKSERFEQNYQKIKNGKVDILIGTQTLAKGLDLPKLSLVGVVAADSSLFIPDYLAQERTYQLISQVIGRVGRGHRSGKVIIQTYEPDSKIIKDVLGKNWLNFYKKELEERKRFRYPPFFYLLKLSCKRASSSSAQKTSEALAKKISGEFSDVIISGPAPAYHEKQGTKYEWQILIKSKKHQTLVDIAQSLPSGWSFDIDPINLL